MRAIDPLFRLSGVLAVLAGCAPAAPQAGGADGGGSRPLAVRSPAAAFTFADGAAAKRQADAECGPRGVRTSIYDRFDAVTATWVFVEGCA